MNKKNILRGATTSANREGQSSFLHRNVPPVITRRRDFVENKKFPLSVWQWESAKLDSPDRVEKLVLV
jgi:hypothetical protein